MTSQAVWWLRDLVRPVCRLSTLFFCATDSIVTNADPAGHRHSTVFHDPRQRSLFIGEQGTSQSRAPHRCHKPVFREIVCALAACPEHGTKVAVSTSCLASRLMFISWNDYQGAQRQQHSCRRSLSRMDDKDAPTTHFPGPTTAQVSGKGVCWSRGRAYVTIAPVQMAH